MGSGEEEGGGGGLGLFHMVDAEASMAYACPCQVLRPDPSQPPTATTCLNSNLLRTHPYAATSVGRLDGPLPSNNLGSAPPHPRRWPHDSRSD